MVIQLGNLYYGKSDIYIIEKALLSEASLVISVGEPSESQGPERSIVPEDRAKRKRRRARAKLTGLDD
jgi:hypothetical protein